jgi:hypothetical protein
MKLELVDMSGIAQRDFDQLILDTELAKKDAELQDNANIHAGLMSVSNEAIKALQAEIEVLKANDIRQYIPDGKYCKGCGFLKYDSYDWDRRWNENCVCPTSTEHFVPIRGEPFTVHHRIGKLTREDKLKDNSVLKAESCPKPDKGEVKP